jgi:superfamily II DNA or RNA helicase
MEPRFKKGDSVVRCANRSDSGQIVAEPILDGGEYWYRVQMHASRQLVHLAEEQLDEYAVESQTVESLAKSGHFGPLESFRRALAVERIHQRDRSTVYSFNAQRILFEPYQYKPLLKLLDSMDRRLLIADEVGLGKTIEAGLILSELEARQSMDKVLVVCPSRLRQKWREELNRKFGQDFSIYEKRSLLEYLDRLAENPSRSRLRGIISMQSLRNRELLDRLQAGIEQLDLVVVDEAHHARNRGTLASAMLHDLCEFTDTVILLTATPLHLGNQDLFTLVSALRPTEFSEVGTFDSQLRRHEPILEALAQIRTRDPGRIPTIRDSIRSVFADPRTGLIRDPLAQDVLDALGREAPSRRRAWIELERKVDRLHPLATIVTRTRKVDVQEHRAQRRPQVDLVPWSDAESLVYSRLVDGVDAKGWVKQSLGFGQMQLARQAASCLPAVLEARGTTFADELADELSDIHADDLPNAGGDAPPVFRADLIPATVVKDSKFEKLLEILKTIESEEPGAKVLIFTYFVGTSKYLSRRLTECGITALRIAGDVPSTPNRPETDERGKIIDRFRNDDSARALVSTEVGSEGLDFQFCHHLVNYDLPWNPMVVEQRIGRIDRYGQTADAMVIRTIVVEGTVEERILLRLYQRIKIFERSVGDLEAILGETVRELQADYLAGRLRPEEADARVEQAAQAIENRQMHLEELEANAANLFGHEEFIRDEMERVRKLGRYLSPRALLSVVRGFLDVRHPNLRLKEETDEGESVYSVRLTDSLRADLRDASRGELVMDRPDGKVWFTTDGQTAFRKPRLELLNVAHPLVRASVDTLRGTLEDPVSRVGAGRVDLLVGEDLEIPDGEVAIVVFTQKVEGVRARKILEVVAWSYSRSELLGAEAAERLLSLMVEKGEGWTRPEPPRCLDSLALDSINTEARRRNRSLQKDEQRENDALVARRRSLIEDEGKRRIDQTQARLATAEKRGREESVLRMFRAQLEKAIARRDHQLSELQVRENVSVVLGEPIAIGVVDVRRK